MSPGQDPFTNKKFSEQILSFAVIDYYFCHQFIPFLMKNFFEAMLKFNKKAERLHCLEVYLL